MKRTILSITAITLLSFSVFAQSALEASVAKLDKANSDKQYQQLAKEFLKIAETQKNQWLPYYYAAYCDARISWMKKETDPDNIQQFAEKAIDEANKAAALLDTSAQKKELSEIYCLLSMANRAIVYINPMTYGRKYGIIAMQNTALARQSNPDNPRALYIEGWEKYATPKLYGGDKQKAKELLLAAQQKMNGDAGVNPHWGREDIDALLKKIK
jgi:hypothetical protein